jgi:hypothetical protein
LNPEVLNLKECLSSIPDPRRRRGIRHPFVGMLMLALVGLLARQTNLQAIIDHGDGHWDTLGLELGFLPRFGVPHATTLSRLLARVPVELLQEAFTCWMSALFGTVPLVAAVDGKYPHQSTDENGSPLGILSVFAHDLKVCLAQWVVSDKEAEPTVLKEHLRELFAAFPGLQVLTGDALFAQRPLCILLVEAHRGYLFRIKGNQPNVEAALVETFAHVPQDKPDAETVDKRDGCLETRRLWVDQETAAYVDTELGFVGAQQVARLDKIVRDLATDLVSSETWYLVSRDPARLLSADQLLQRTRGHWQVENSLHHVKDRSWGEDKHTLRRPGLGGCFSVLLNIALTALRIPDSFNPEMSMPRRAKRCEVDPLLAVSLIT